MSTLNSNGEPQAPPIVRAMMTVAWISFLFASVATMLFFATFDPEQLIIITTLPIDISPLGVYSIGFLLFWLLAAGTAALSCYLLSLPIEKQP